MRFSRLLLYLVYSAFVCFLVCPERTVSQQPFFDYLTIKEGLPHNSVYAVSQDPSGFIWLGTQSGLVRYDAYTFKTFSSVRDIRGTDIDIKAVHSLYTDTKGVLWIGTDTDGLISFDLYSGKWKLVLDYSAVKARINSIFEDSKGQMWIGTMGDGVLVTDKTGTVLKHFLSENSTLENNNVFSFAQNKNGRVWIACAGNGVHFSDLNLTAPQKIIPTDGPIHSFRKCLLVDNSDQLWIGTEGEGLYLLNAQTNQTVHYFQGSSKEIPVNSISDIIQLPSGEIWLSSDGGGLMRVRTEEMRFQHFKNKYFTENSINTNNILKLFSDRDQHLWICTFNGGVNLIKKKFKQFYNLKEWSGKNVELSNQSVLSVCETKNGKIYFGTDGAGVDVWDKKKGLWSRLTAKNVPSNYFSQSVIKTICEDNRGNIWIGYFNKGLDRFDPFNQTIVHFKKEEDNVNGLSGESVWSVRLGQDGKIYIATLDGGLCIYDYQSNKFKKYLHDPNNPSSISDNRIFDVLPDKYGNVWIATQNNGLDFYDAKYHNFTHYKRGGHLSSISADDTRCIFTDSKNRLWIGTESGGLNLFTGNGNFKTLTKKDGLLSNAIMSITEDSNNNLWISGFQGICRFQPENVKFNNFDFHVPQNSNQFNQNAGIMLQDGTICFGGISGPTFFNPLNILSNTGVPTVHFSDFKVLNASVFPNDGSGVYQNAIDFAEEVRLHYDQYPFSIEFSSLNFADPYNTDYSYAVEGIDNKWHLLEKGTRTITFNSLNPGTYTLKVKASNSNGIWEEKYRSLKLVILPPFWKTWWFRTLSVLLILGLVIRGIQLYNQRREEKWRIALIEQEKTILSLQNEKLAKESESKSSELMSKAMQMGHKSEVMQSLKEGLESLRIGQTDVNIRKIRALESIVHNELHDEDNWKQLAMYFDQVNHHFTEKLLKTYPFLTQNDLRICILIKLNLSIKEMAALLNVSIQGIEKSKYRLKKRLQLGIEDDLTEFLRTFA